MMKRTILATVMAAVLGLAGSANAASIIGGQTDVTFDAGVAALFAGVNPLGTATQNGLTFTFPVTGGSTSPLMIEHNGSGVELINAGADSLELRDFLIDGTAATVFGSAFFNGALVGNNLDLFLVLPGLRLGLTATTAPVLTSFLSLNTPLPVGFEIATANPQPQVPEPATLLLMGSALGFAALRRRKR